MSLKSPSEGVEEVNNEESSVLDKYITPERMKAPGIQLAIFMAVMGVFGLIHNSWSEMRSRTDLNCARTNTSLMQVGEGGVTRYNCDPLPEKMVRGEEYMNLVRRLEDFLGDRNQATTIDNFDKGQLVAWREGDRDSKIIVDLIGVQNIGGDEPDEEYQRGDKDPSIIRLEFDGGLLEDGSRIAPSVIGAFIKHDNSGKIELGVDVNADGLIDYGLSVSPGESHILAPDDISKYILDYALETVAMKLEDFEQGRI
jgi:hypothetical protein